MHSTIALMILRSATNVAFGLSKWVRDKVVKLFQGGASVVSVTVKSSNSFIFMKNTVTPHL